MSDGGPIGYSYPPSGSTIEPIDLTSTRPSSRPSSRRVSSTGANLSWHPKVTLYRLFDILSTVGLAVAKTATSYLNLTFASITLEWILGVVVFLFFHLLGTYEETSNRYLTWLFDVDYMEYFWAFIEKLTGFKRPYYISDKIDARHQATGIHLPVTGYRIIVTIVVTSVGMTKSALLYGQQPIEATTVECVFGVGIVTILYCLGLYEGSSIKVYPRLFHVDYSGGLSYVTETVVVFLYLFALFFSCAASYGFYLCTASVFSPDMAAKMNGTKTVDLIMLTILIGGLSSCVSLLAAFGTFVVVYYLGRRYRASPPGQFVAGLPGVRLIPDMHREYWLPSGDRPRPRFFYLKRLIIRQIVKMPLHLVLFYLMMVTVLYCVAILLALCLVFSNLLKDRLWYWLLGFVPISLFMIYFIVGSIIVLVQFMYSGVVNYVLDAWMDFTVEVGLSNVPADIELDRV